MAIKIQQLYEDTATMLDAGLSIRRALNVSIRNSRGRIRMALIKIDAAIENGNTLTDAMRTASEGFDDDTVFIETGEKSGKLAESFKAVARWHSLKASAWASILAGIVNPCLQVHAAAFILPLPMFYVGKITTTEYMIAVSSFLLIALYIPLGVLMSIYWVCRTQGHIRKLIDNLLLRVPLLGDVVRDMAIARYCGGFVALYDAGVPIAECAKTAPGLCGNAGVASMFEGGAESAGSGNPVSEGFSRDLPCDVLAIWHAGEQAGKLAESLQRLSAQELEAAERNLKELVRWVRGMFSLLVIALLTWVIISGSSL